MRFISFMSGDHPALGVRVGDELANITDQGLPASLEALLRAGPDGLSAAAQAVERAQRVALSQIAYLPPIAAPAKAIAVGLNYRDHADEMSLEVPSYPVLFNRYPSSWVGHREPIVLPSVSSELDYEGELAVVIGAAGRHITKQAALSHVAGYSIFNDGSVRDYQYKSHQWMMGKNFDASGAFGPEFVTADELPAGGAGLRITTRLNGAVMQDGNSSDMIFDVATLVATVSEVMALSVGDVIFSGTPTGVGYARDPQVFMRPGDVCEVEIEGIGILRNAIRAER